MSKEITPEVQASFEKAYETGIIPEFEGKGLYTTSSSSWNKTGFSAEPQYNGQMPNWFPPDWPFIFCHLMADRDLAC